MIIKLDELKPICSKILFALDPSNTLELSDVVQLKVENGKLQICVTNGEYFVKVGLSANGVDTFNATVNANSFLKLIPQFSQEEVELTTDGNALSIKCDGSYKIPLIYEGEEMLELPQIEISNISNSFEIDSAILRSVFDYNSKEFKKGKPVRPVQELYYIDNQGAITYTSGACVNKFTLPEDIKILLNQKLVRLFKIFEEGKVQFTLGTDMISQDISQTKVRFENPETSITAKINCSERLMNSYPVEAIRNKSMIEYPYNMSLNKNVLIKALNRLMIFDKGENSGCNVTFGEEYLSISNEFSPDNEEKIYYESGSTEIETPYYAKLNLNDFKVTLENCSEQFIVMSYGNNETIAITRNNILTILPERHG